MEKAISSSVIRAANGNAEKLAYLLDIEQGKGDNFLFDVLFKCEYDANPRRYTGRNGKEICSRSYNSNILSEAFGNSTISSNSYGYSKKFSEILGKRFERVCKEMEDDIDKGIRNRDYILDSNDKVVSEDLAMAIAYDFLLSREENEDIIEKLPNDYNLILSKTIYETEGVPSAYKFDIEDEKDMLTHSIFRIFCYTSVALIWERRWKEGKSG